MFEHTSLKNITNYHDDLKFDTIKTWLETSKKSFWFTYGFVQFLRVCLLIAFFVLADITFDDMPWLGGLLLIVYAGFIYISELYLRAMSIPLRSAIKLQGFYGSDYEKQKIQSELLDAALGALSIKRPFGDITAAQHSKITSQIYSLKQQNESADEAKLLNPQLQAEIRQLKIANTQVQQEKSVLQTANTTAQAELEKFRNASRTAGKSLGLADDKEFFGELEKRLSAQGVSASQAELLSLILCAIREEHPTIFSKIDDFSHIPDEILRIRQYDAIIRMYAQKIQDLRSSEMDDDVQEDAIEQMSRLRDREIELLEGHGA